MDRNTVMSFRPGERAGRREGVRPGWSVVALGAASLLALLGCGWVSAESKQGKELESILRQHRTIPIAVTDDVPIHFDPPEVERKAEATSVSYRAVVVWHRNDSLERLQQRVRKLAEGHKRDVGKATVTQIAFLLTYQDQQGKPCGSETVWIEVQEEEGKVVLPSLGKDGSPFKATAQLVRLRTLEKHQMPIGSSVATFVELDKVEFEQYREMALNALDNSVPLVVAHLPWKLAGTPAEVRARLKDQVLGKRPELREQEARAMTLILEYCDAQGRSCGKEKVEISLNADRGTLTLKQVPMGRPIVAISASLSGFVVQGRMQHISLP